MKSLVTLICSQLQVKPLIIPKKERKGDKHVSVLSIATNYLCLTTYDLNVEVIFLEIE